MVKSLRLKLRQVSKLRTISKTIFSMPKSQFATLTYEIIIDFSIANNRKLENFYLITIIDIERGFLVIRFRLKKHFW